MVLVSAYLPFALARQTLLLGYLQVRTRKLDKWKVEGVTVGLGNGHGMGSGPLCSFQRVSNYSECRLTARDSFFQFRMLDLVFSAKVDPLSLLALLPRQTSVGVISSS